MFRYPLKGKSVILALAPDFIPSVRAFGIEGSPLFAKVHSQEEDGLWLETGSFALCPTGVKSTPGPGGEPVCRAHIFIPEQAVVSAVVFPGGTAGELETRQDLHRIGFAPRASIDPQD
ncbi:MAG: hypothetical protein KGL53_16530 [Elusimicrobia bacterium]|nr:hypothetical protein [Elusimicrobiota bacterium]